jgi:CBS domain-containing protein
MEKETKTARQLLARKPGGTVAVRPEDSVLTALRAMAERDIGAVLVMEGERLLGIFTERDHARRLDLEGRSSATTPVREVMTGKVVFATPGNTVDQCMALMKQMRVRHLPVVDGHKVVGMLSVRDVLEELISEEEHLIQELQRDRLYFTSSAGYY